jgi:hypothetical protein
MAELTSATRPCYTTIRDSTRLRWFGPHLEPPAMGLHHLLGPAQAERDLRLVHQPVPLDLHHQRNIPFS